MQGQKKAVNAENNQHIGVICGGKNTKSHAVVDGLGNPVHFMLSDGQVHDSKVAVELLSGVNITVSNILGNKAYGTAATRDYITDQNAQRTIPPKENNPNPWLCDFWLYKEALFYF